jgi:DMSO/TMAO reductase YedYZ molybdopterin-dependent catalytic subunit
MSQGKWTGVSLKDLLEQVGLPKSTKEIVFEGADFGQKPGISGSISFKRSLPIEKALHPDTILAYQYNDKPLHFKHGFPFRLIVPNWYAMTSVKWLNRIQMIDHSFEGPFQTDDFVYYPYKDSTHDSFPVTTLNVNSTIQQPLHYSILNTGFHQIKGIAWTGRGAITEVQVSFDKGESWEKILLSIVSPLNIMLG